jgi:sugar/nucleoside kinase (ribokinase family)
MAPTTNRENIDYLMVGHLTIDRTTEGPRIGGTAAYSAMTARQLGLKAGIYTAWGEEIASEILNKIPIVNLETERSTTFENFSKPEGRVQRLYHAAPVLDGSQIPQSWRTASIIHIGPVAGEVKPDIIGEFPTGLIGLTPQGWLRAWDKDGWVSVSDWPEAVSTLKKVDAAVVSMEDMSYDEEKLEEMTNVCKVLAVTEGEKGVRLYWNGDVRRFRPPVMEALDTTGAGDIFAAALFIRLYSTRDPWEAARFATQLAAYSVTRRGLDAIPNQDEINACMVEVL